MAEHIELEFLPTILRVETTATGIQDSAIMPTATGHLPDTDATTINFFNPAISVAAAQQQASNLLARKGGNLHLG